MGRPKKEKPQAVTYEYEYRLKPFHATAKQKSEWRPVSVEDMEKIKRMEPHRYEFREKQPLVPTKNMIVKETE